MIDKEQFYKRIKDKDISYLLKSTIYSIHLRKQNGADIHRLLNLQATLSFCEKHIKRKNNSQNNTLEKYRLNYRKECENTLQALLESTEFGVRF